MSEQPAFRGSSGSSTSRMGSILSPHTACSFPQSYTETPGATGVLSLGERETFFASPFNDTGDLIRFPW